KGGPGIVESDEVVWRDKEESMSHACAIRVSAYHPVPIVKSKQDCRNGARSMDWEGQGPVGVPVLAVKDSCGIYIVSHRQFFVIIHLVSKGRGSTRDGIRRYGPATVDERLEDPVAGIKRAGKVAGIVYPKEISLERAGKIVFCEGPARQEERVNGAIAGGVVTGY